MDEGLVYGLGQSDRPTMQQSNEGSMAGSKHSAQAYSNDLQGPTWYPSPCGATQESAGASQEGQEEVKLWTRAFTVVSLGKEQVRQSKQA